MREAKHTAGEWKDRHIDDMEEVNGVSRPTGNKRRVINATRKQTAGRVTQYIAEVFEQAAHADQGAANARLIAAAPELLEALQSLEPMFGDYISTMLAGKIPGWQNVDDKFIKARAAIAKATASEGAA